MSVVALVGGAVCTGEEVLRDRAVVVADGCIEDIVSAEAVPAGARVVRVEGLVAPGLVDLQVNGGGDVLLNDALTLDGVRAIVRAHRRLGTAGVMTTLVSASRACIEGAVGAVRAALAGGVAGLVGLHVEGPFISPERPGAHDPAQIRAMTGADAELLCSLDAPTLVTLAPECVEPALVERLLAGGVVVSAGHSSATPTDLSAAAARGVSLVTHLYNAMSGIRAREPGLAGAALAEDRVACGLIADGHHVAPAPLAMALRCKPPGGLFLVSDAMPPVGGSATRFALGGREIEVRDGRCVAPDGGLAGSAASLADCMAQLVTLGEVSVVDALRMASTVPADLIGVGGEFGRLVPGRVADLIVVDERGELRLVMAAGRIVR